MLDMHLVRVAVLWALPYISRRTVTRDSQLSLLSDEPGQLYTQSVGMWQIDTGHGAHVSQGSEVLTLPR